MILDTQLIEKVYYIGYYLGIAFLPLGLFYLILNVTLKNIHYRKKVIVNLSIGIIFTIIFICSFFVDYRNDDLSNYLLYFFFIGASTIYPSLIITTIYSRRGNFSKSSKTLKIVESKQKLCIVYKYQNYIYLKKEKDNYYPFTHQLKKEFFHDEIIESILDKYHLDSRDVNIKKVGYVYINKEVIYTYLVTLFEKTEFNDLEEIDAYDLVRIPMSKFNQEITMKTIIGEEFKIER